MDDVNEINEIADWLQAKGITMWSTFSPIYERTVALQAAEWFRNEMIGALNWHDENALATEGR